MNETLKQFNVCMDGAEDTLNTLLLKGSGRKSVVASPWICADHLLFNDNVEQFIDDFLKACCKLLRKSKIKRVLSVRGQFKKHGSTELYRLKITGEK